MRLFVALELSDAMRAAAGQCSDALRKALGARSSELSFSRVETMHVTLRFLGATDPAHLPALEAALLKAGAGGPPFELTLGELGAFPNPRHPRVFWMGFSAGVEPLSALAQRVEDELLVAGLPREERAFRAHLTLARAREHTGAPSLERQLEALDVPHVSMRVEELVLFESRLHPTGAEHFPLVRARLGS